MLTLPRIQHRYFNWGSPNFWLIFFIIFVSISHLYFYDNSVFGFTLDSLSGFRLYLLWKLPCVLMCSVVFLRYKLPGLGVFYRKKIFGLYLFINKRTLEGKEDYIWYKASGCWFVCYCIIVMMAVSTMTCLTTLIRNISFQ